MTAKIVNNLILRKNPIPPQDNLARDSVGSIEKLLLSFAFHPTWSKTLLAAAILRRLPLQGYFHKLHSTIHFLS